MGSCNNCYAFAALAGIAEGEEGEEFLEEHERGDRIKSRFLTKEVNQSGCYALKFIIDG